MLGQQLRRREQLRLHREVPLHERAVRPDDALRVDELPVPCGFRGVGVALGGAGADLGADGEGHALLGGLLEEALLGLGEHERREAVQPRRAQVLRQRAVRRRHLESHELPPRTLLLSLACCVPFLLGGSHGGATWPTPARLRSKTMAEVQRM